VNAALAVSTGSRSVLPSAQRTRPGSGPAGRVPASLKCPDPNASFSRWLLKPALDGTG
jgi:hypothetical protein